MFYNCSSLLSLPDISKWNMINVEALYDMFGRCSSLLFLPDISKWNTNKSAGVHGMFSGCLSLTSIPDITKWNISNIESIEEMFSGCSSLISIPDISKFKGNKINIKNIFYNCHSLISLPNINYSRVYANNSGINTFKGCFSLISSLPIIISHEEEKYSEPGEWASMMGEVGYWYTNTSCTFKSINDK